MVRGILAGALLVACAAVQAEECPVATGFITRTTTVEGVTRRHTVYVPADYTPEKAWPMVMFLHGAGERGEDGIFQTEVGIGTAIRRYPERFRSIVVFPQCPRERFWDSILPELDAIYEQVHRDYNIDPQRRYLTGISMGGYGAFSWGADHAERWAAILPLCGGGVPQDMNRITKDPIDLSKFGSLKERVAKLATVPVWVFHGLKDSSVPPFRSKQMVRMLERAGGKVRFTEYEELGHDVWTTVYADENVIRWMFEQQQRP
jgi:predicted peptidase